MAPPVRIIGEKNLPAVTRRRLRDWRRLDRQASRAREGADDRRADVLERLRAAGCTNREAGELVGISERRAKEILQERREERENSGLLET